MKNKKMLRIKISGIVAAILVLLFVIYGCYLKIRDNLQLEMEQTLQDVATQNVLAVENEISDKFRLMHSLSRELASLPQEKDTILDNMRPFVENYGFKRMGYISLYGTAYTTDGYIQNISFRDFFQEGLKGNAVITDAMEDAIGDNHELINVISVPICDVNTNEVTGVLFASYQSERFQDTLNVESFNGVGYSYIIKTDGTLIAASKDAPMHGDTNIFSHALQYDNSNSTVIQEMKADIEAGNSGTIRYLYDGARDAYYTPLDISEGNIHWYMMTVVPSQVLHDRLTPVMRVVMALLIFIVAAAVLSIFLYLYSYHKAQKELIRLAYEDSVTKGA
ncbi:MAG: cache domain-containing protein, partial [Roseburia sp.]|nr:cache domain-containing protein [Roseburia sp.]